MLSDELLVVNFSTRIKTFPLNQLSLIQLSCIYSFQVLFDFRSEFHVNFLSCMVWSHDPCFCLLSSLFTSDKYGNYCESLDCHNDPVLPALVFLSILWLLFFYKVKICFLILTYEWLTLTKILKGCISNWQNMFCRSEDITFHNLPYIMCVSCKKLNFHETKYLFSLKLSVRWKDSFITNEYLLACLFPTLFCPC